MPAALPEGCYRLEADLSPSQATRAALGWALGSYAFSLGQKQKKSFASLIWPKAANRPNVEQTASAITLIRDLINAPANTLDRLSWPRRARHGQ
ncbi:hypothetical protein CCP2SC5_780003 [Azospirillaceae bacterium]